jgi:serine/threonine protein kinase
LKMRKHQPAPASILSHLENGNWEKSKPQHIAFVGIVPCADPTRVGVVPCADPTSDESEYGKMPDQQNAHPGQPIGEYRLMRKLGGGSFGTVYLAEHVHEHTQAAVKVLNVQLTRSEDFKDFIKEASTIRLRHPHIVPLLNFGISRDDLPYLVMEYAPQGTLRDRHPKGERIPLITIVSYINQLVLALQYAHDQRVIHRDIKPENILVRADGTLLVSDFGVAKTLEQGISLNTQTPVGTPPYLAPEQYMGHPCFASDQYSLAVIVYEWICGVRPFEGSEVGLVYQHQYTPPPSLRDRLPMLPASVERVVFKALAKAPEDRFSRIQEFGSALHDAVEPLPSMDILSPTSETNLPQSSEQFPKKKKHRNAPVRLQPLNTSLYNTVPLISPEQVQASSLEPETSVDASRDTESAPIKPDAQKADLPVAYRSILPAPHTSPSETQKNVALPPPQKRHPGRIFFLFSLIVFFVVIFLILVATLFMRIISLIYSMWALIVVKYMH